MAVLLPAFGHLNGLGEQIGVESLKSGWPSGSVEIVERGHVELRFLTDFRADFVFTDLVPRLAAAFVALQEGVINDPVTDLVTGLVQHLITDLVTVLEHELVTGLVQFIVAVLVSVLVSGLVAGLEPDPQ